MNNSKKPIFDIAVVSLIFCFLLSILLFHRAVKSKTDFSSIKGPVASIGNKTAIYPNNNPEKYRYLKLENHPKPFELFVGKKAGDFKPAVDKLDDIKVGDTLAIYYNNSPLNGDAPVNRLACFIDRGNETLFIKGTWEKYLAYLIAGTCVIMSVWVVMLWKKGRIA